MRLSRLADGFDVRGTRDPDVTGMSEDTRRITPGMAFVAVPGAALDGHDFVAQALARGAVAIVAERDLDLPEEIPLVRVDSARRALAVLAARFYGHPARDLTVVGFTGTFGKTSTSEILRTLLTAAGLHPGVVGSLGARYGGFHDPGNGLTTPAPVELQRALRGLRDAGADTAIVEVTSHALRMDRAHGLVFGGGVIAAIMPGEHTDFHHSFEDYVAAKRLFLDYLAPDAVLAFDADNRVAAALASEARVATRAGVSLDGCPASLQVSDVVLDHTGARFMVQERTLQRPITQSSTGHSMHSALLGRGHLHNVALGLAYATAAGLKIADAAAVLRDLAPLRRRMERYTAGGRTVLDDTAAHPDSFRATFEVADLLSAGLKATGGGRSAVAYAVRGRRGVDINRRNALALADRAAHHGVESLIVTAAADVLGPTDLPSAAEIDAARGALEERGRPVIWHDSLKDAMRAAAGQTRAGDLVVLVGAQGMNEGKRLFGEATGSPV
jgi:UDP-N-acetylmuramoyl-L-alanyl-D-glutamate--2,6-diaminopimelate ligase